MKNALASGFLALVVMVSVCGSGCATSEASRAADSRPMVVCHVCEYNNDLGCVCFRLKESTPRLTYGSKEYFFCSEDCRTSFQRKPAKYIPKAEAQTAARPGQTLKP